jgi:hypothetical protein
MSLPDIPSPVVLKESALPLPSMAEGGDVPMTAGQRIYKTATYLSVDWVWNAACGVAFSDFMNYNKIGKEGGKRLSLGWEKGLSTFIKEEAALASSVKNACTFTNIILGGMMTIPPLLILEKPHVKQAAAEWLDRRIYGDDAVEHDPYFHAAYQKMANEPKKDFAVGMVARVAALAPLLGLVITERSKQGLQKHVFEPFTDESKYLANKTVLNKDLVANHMPPDMQSASHAQERWNNLHDSLAMDLSFGLPYAAMHSFWYDRFAEWMAPKKEAQEDKASPTESIPTTRIREGASVRSEKGISPQHVSTEIAAVVR